MNFRPLIIGFYVVLFVGIGVGAALFFWRTQQEYQSLRRIERQTERRLTEMREKLREQERVLDRLRTDPAYVEKIIRQRLGYAKPDEFIFRFENN